MPKLDGIDTIGLGAQNFNRTESAFWGPRSSGLKTTRPRTSSRSSNVPSGTTRTSISSCFTRPCRARRFTREISAQGRMLGRGRVPLGRHPWSVPVQLPPSSYTRGPGNQADRTGVPAGFRGQRPEHAAGAADHPGRLAAVQEPPGSADSTALRLGSRGHGNHLFRSRRRQRGGITGRTRLLYAKMSGLLEEMNREFGWTSRLFATVGGPYVCGRSGRRKGDWPGVGPMSHLRSMMSTTP